MKKQVMIGIMGTMMLAGCSQSNQVKQEESFDYTVEQFADLQLLRYKVHGFEELPLAQKQLVYYLSEAALQGRDILFDQNGKYNLIIRKMLETVYTDYQGDRTDANFKNMEVYLKRVWFSNGIHHHYAADKFIPGFTPEFFRAALESVDVAKLPLAEGQTLNQLCELFLP
jgi:dipeptidyl-peptidase-3